jgi:hypothetical protein
LEEDNYNDEAEDEAADGTETWVYVASHLEAVGGEADVVVEDDTDGTETWVYVASYLEAVGGEVEVVDEDGEEDNDEPEDDANGTKTWAYVASYLEAVGVEAEVVVEDGEEDNDDEESEEDTDWDRNMSLCDLSPWGCGRWGWGCGWRWGGGQWQWCEDDADETETWVYVASHLEAVGGEAEVVVEDGRRTMTMMRPRMMQQMGQKHESMWPLILRL